MKSSLHTRVSLRCAAMLKFLAQAEEAEGMRRLALEALARQYCGSISRILLEPHKGTRVAGKKRARLPDVKPSVAD